MPDLSPPADVAVEVTADLERIILTTPPRKPDTHGCIILFVLFGSLFGSMFGMSLAAEIPNHWVAIPLAVLFFLGCMGGAPILGMEILRRIDRWRNPGSPVIELTPIMCRIQQQSIHWGELKFIEYVGSTLQFHRDDGEAIVVELHDQSPERMRWLHQHLQAQLEQLAPGSPEDVPYQLSALLEPTETP